MNKSREEILSICNSKCKDTLLEVLDIQFVDVSDSFLVAKMPVTSRVHQPDGVLHGGATVALAETVGSAAAFIFLESERLTVRAIEISANHVRTVSSGYVYAKATILHKGKTTQLIQVQVTNEKGDLISLVKLTTITLKN